MNPCDDYAGGCPPPTSTCAVSCVPCASSAGSPKRPWPSERPLITSITNASSWELHLRRYSPHWRGWDGHWASSRGCYYAMNQHWFGRELVCATLGGEWW